MAARAADLGIPAVILFGIPERKDAVGSEAWSANGVSRRPPQGSRSAVPTWS